jgi:TrmH family RNA methyltransferase
METAITSFSNLKIKNTIKLRESNYRREQRRFLIDGLREIERAELCGIQFLEFFVLESKIETARNLSIRSNAVINIVSELLLQKIVFGNRNDGIAAVAQTPINSFDRNNNFPKIKNTLNPLNSLNRLTGFHVESKNELCNKPAADFTEFPLYVVLEGIEKPGNIGAVFRTADGAGVNGIILADILTDLYNPNVVRSSLGTLFSIPVVETTSVNAREWLLKQDIKIVAAKCDGELLYTNYDFKKPTAIVLGSEANGLTKLWNGKNVTSIKIPMNGIADSLNVSTAASILLYEARRQTI